MQLGTKASNVKECGGLRCRWCAMTMGLPLEAPREATRGWDVATLRAGMQGLNPDHAPKLGLFCRSVILQLLASTQDCPSAG